MNFDEETLHRLKNLQPAAFETLVERFEGPLYRFFYLDHRDHHMAQEQTAETFTQLVRAMPKMRGGPEQLAAFVFKIASRVQQQRWRMRPNRAIPIDAVASVADPLPDPTDHAVAHEQLELILQAVARLEQPLRNVMHLRFVEEYSLEEIAQTLEMPKGTVKSHIHRGRERLKQSLKAEDCQR